MIDFWEQYKKWQEECIWELQEQGHDVTIDIEKCELYSLGDFQKHYGNGCIKCDEPVKMCFDYKKKYKNYDTVLVDVDELKEFLSFI